MYSCLGFMVNSDLSQRVWHVVIVKQTLSDIHQWLAIKVYAVEPPNSGHLDPIEAPLNTVHT